MARYINCELVCAEVDKGDLLVGNNAEWVKEIIYRTPAADVVEVVRCKDCAFYRPMGRDNDYKGKPMMICSWHSITSRPNEYCNHGKRRKENEM